MMFLAFMAAAALPAFDCRVTKVHDGDGPIWCANGRKVRTAGVQAPDFENAEPCRTGKPGYICSDVLARRSQQVVARMILNTTMSCQPVDRSWDRVVARCTMAVGRSLTCATIASGAATRWDSYWRRYRLKECR